MALSDVTTKQVEEDEEDTADKASHKNEEE